MARSRYIYWVQWEDCGEQLSAFTVKREAEGWAKKLTDCHVPAKVLRSRVSHRPLTKGGAFLDEAEEV